MVWYDTFDNIFWLGIGGFVTGLVVVSCKYCYRCKVSELALCCGLVKLYRNTIQENETDIEKGDADSIPSATSPYRVGFPGFSFSKSNTSSKL